VGHNESGSETRNRRKLVLAFPPYATAFSPPLGVCSLKGFLERSVTNWSVKVMDLNLAMHQAFFDHLARRPVQPGEGLAERLAGETLLGQAARVFGGENAHEFYLRPDRYLLYGKLWQNLPGQLAPVEQLRAAYLGSATMPVLVARCASAILAEAPDVVGLSICYNQQLDLALCLARELKRRTTVPVIAGGTFFNEGTGDFLQRHPAVFDYVICGEGERPLARYLSGDTPESISGFAYLKDGKGRVNPPGGEEDLNLLGAPDYSDVDLRAYYTPRPVLPILTSRGCYWQRCAFCTHYKSAGQSYRQRSIPQVIEELQAHVARGVRHFVFVDEMIAPGRFADLAQAILAAGLDVRYYAMAKPVPQFDRRLLTALHASGCRYLLWGVESGSQRVLDLIDKGTKAGETEKVLEAAKQAGLKSHVFVIFGFPTETAAELQSTIDLLARHKESIAMVHRGLFTLEAGSPAYLAPEKFAIADSWPSETPGVYDYRCDAGMTREEAREAFARSLPFLRSFASPFPELGDAKFREHLLLIYCLEDTHKV